MRVQRNWFVIIGLACFLGSTAERARAGATITFSGPAANQNYAVNANIAFSGNVTWTAQTPYLDKVVVDYVWTNGGNAPAPGAGTIVTSQDAELKNYTLNDPNDQSSGGTSGFDNLPSPPNTPLTATQYTMPGPGGQAQTTT